MRQYIDVIGLVWMLWGALQLSSVLVIGALVLLGLGTMGLTGAGIQDGDLVIAAGVYGIATAVVVLLTVLIAGLEIAVGRGVRGRKPWARISVMILAMLGLMNLPVGTVLGIFTLMVMLDAEVAQEFSAA